MLNLPAEWISKFEERENLVFRRTNNKNSLPTVHFPNPAPSRDEHWAKRSNGTSATHMETRLPVVPTEQKKKQNPTPIWGRWPSCNRCWVPLLPSFAPHSNSFYFPSIFFFSSRRIDKGREFESEVLPDLVTGVLILISPCLFIWFLISLYLASPSN